MRAHDACDSPWHNPASVAELYYAARLGAFDLKPLRNTAYLCTPGRPDGINAAALSRPGFARPGQSPDRQHGSPSRLDARLRRCPVVDPAVRVDTCRRYRLHCHTRVLAGAPNLHSNPNRRFAAPAPEPLPRTRPQPPPAPRTFFGCRLLIYTNTACLRPWAGHGSPKRRNNRLRCSGAPGSTQHPAFASNMHSRRVDPTPLAHTSVARVQAAARAHDHSAPGGAHAPANAPAQSILGASGGLADRNASTRCPSPQPGAAPIWRSCPSSSRCGSPASASACCWAGFYWALTRSRCPLWQPEPPPATADVPNTSTATQRLTASTLQPSAAQTMGLVHRTVARYTAPFPGRADCVRRTHRHHRRPALCCATLCTQPRHTCAGDCRWLWLAATGVNTGTTLFFAHIAALPPARRPFHTDSCDYLADAHFAAHRRS